MWVVGNFQEEIKPKIFFLSYSKRTVASQTPYFFWWQPAKTSINNPPKNLPHAIDIPSKQLDNPSSPSQNNHHSTHCSTNQLPKQPQTFFHFHSLKNLASSLFFFLWTNEPLTHAGNEFLVSTKKLIMENTTTKTSARSQIKKNKLSILTSISLSDLLRKITLR